MKAEVGLLSRSIRIIGGEYEEQAEQEDGFVELCAWGAAGAARNGDVGAEEDQCLGQERCTISRGGLNLGGALRLGIFVRACVEAGRFLSICPNLQIEPARLQARIGGNIVNRGENCANPGTTGSVTIGEVKFVSIFNLIFTSFRYERVLFEGFIIPL